ncbi:DUF885 domain-containing protein [Polymorphobacter multimanifer]|uniref:Uncharacterized protein (DUF885 family) n=1 Tax=Polymorphobacter multimanifer TaxID=1070431 RepID=A0A841L048_9SPHN|nr:DUF885 domain-containing protein [Polymorphobacter multimanifer]MBB6226199.1 uncharacterized protein (DUF885 family) [Polymorphobacter multimanifer]
MRSVFLAAVGFCLMVPLAAPVRAQAAEAPADEASRLRKLFADSDEAALKRSPLSALFRGDQRYADQLGDFFSDAALDAQKAAAEADLAALNAIDRDKLSAQDRVSYDVFRWQTETNLKGFAPELVAATQGRPIDHMRGIHTFIPDISTGESAAPYKTVKNYEDGLKRLTSFAFQLDMATARFRQGMAAGVVQPKLVTTNVIGQLDTLLVGGTAASVMMKPVGKFPDSFSAADKARLSADYARVVGSEVNPALARLRDFLKAEYLPVARDSVGLSAMPGGAALYEYLIQTNTTTDLTASEIHDLGLKEVARIRQGMGAVQKRMGVKGELSDFFTFIRTDPRFKPKSKDDLRLRYEAVGKRVNTTVGSLFSTLPKAPLEIRPVPEFREKNDAAGSYQSGTPDGSRPGIFYYNTYDLPSRTTQGIETLYLHEAVPGHHFQISLAQENEALPAFQRFGGNTAFVEGWALYAESLGPELGMFKDPMQLQGRYDDEMLRAMRLVVDTGLHAKNWGRDQAIEYMMANSAMGRTDATIEVERYIAMPGQALAYKIGQLTISRLRADAQAKLGRTFDIRAFHEQVLMTGALPMAVLEKKMADWVAGQR